MIGRIRAFARGTDGTVAIEFAIVGTIFIFLSLGIIDFARNFHTQHRMADLGDKLARVIYLNQSVTAESLQQTLNSLGGSDLSLTVTNATENGVSVKTLTLLRDQDYVSPGLSDLSGRIRIVRKVPLVGAYF
ncbi:MAG: hypothetical protein RIT14_2474 [Pseudomonadota bacterium]|jgi:Flp pilus assembly protein TadG